MAVGVNIVSQFDSKGIRKAISDFKKLEGAGAKSTYALRTFDKAATNGLANVAKFGAVAAAGLGAVALHFVKGAEFAKQADDRLRAVTRTMGLFGSQTQVVTDRLIELADKGEYTYGVLAETIKDTQSKLMTFANIAKEAGTEGGLFDRATIAALDLQAAGFGEAAQNAVQLGKALQDPVKGITALARSGVTFTAQEKEKIKALVESGKLYEAQETLLKAIETQVSGTAEATVPATFKIAAAFGHVRDEIGTLLLPIFEKFANFMVDKVVPYATRLGEIVGRDGLGAAFRQLGTDFLGAIENGGKFTNILLGLVAAFTAMRLVAIAATVAQVAFNTALFMNPIGIVVAAVIALGVAVAALYLKFEPVRDVVNAIGKALVKTFQEIAEKVMNFFIIQINLVIGAINAAIWVANKLGADIEPIGYIAMKSFGDAADAAEQAAKKMAAAQKVAGRPFEQLVGDYRGAMPVIAKAGKQTEETFGGAGKAVETAKQKLEKYIDALKGVTNAQRSARDATKSVTEANRKLADANTRLAETQAYFQRVVAGFGSDSKEAKTQQRALADAQRRVERSGYGVENAVFAVAKAEADLAAIRLDPEASATAIREAEIALAEAKLSVADATDDQRDATDELASAEQRLDEIINGAKEGSQAYKDALDELNDAKRDQADAIDGVTSALEREKDAIDAVREAEEKLRDVRNQTPAQIQARAEAQVNGTTTGGGTGLFPSFMQAVEAMHPNSRALQSATPVKAAKAQFPKLYETYKAAGLALAEGGIVTAPTTALIGEAGPEAVVPLDQLNSGMNITVNISAGMGTDPAALGDEIVNVLQRYNRRNGALPLKVA